MITKKNICSNCGCITEHELCPNCYLLERKRQARIKKEMERQLVENFNRQDMKISDSIDAIRKYVGANKTLSSQQIANNLGISRPWLEQ